MINKEVNKQYTIQFGQTMYMYVYFERLSCYSFVSLATRAG